jgi:hypothetical protein
MIKDKGQVIVLIGAVVVAEVKIFKDGELL